jgi:pyridoxine kinase
MTPAPSVLCLSSHVAYGYVGNDAAAFCLRRLGVEAWQIDTVALSNHPGYGARTGRVVPAAELRALVDGVAARGVLERCGGLLAGYLGAADQAAPVAHAIDTLRAARPGARIVLDPILGDTGPGLYVGEDVAAAIAETLLPRAGVVTPNAFELGWLTGRPVGGVEEALAASRALLARGPELVVATSVPAGAAHLALLAVTRTAAWRVAVPRLDFPVAPNGAGDALAGILTARLLRGADAPAALELAANAIHGVLEATRSAGRRELALVAAQDGLADPGLRFRARAMA